MIPYLEKEKRPVILYGWSNDEEKVAHYWVVDGFAKRTAIQYIKRVKAPDQEEDWKVFKYYYSYFVHCNWGWGGAEKGGKRNDGYFDYRVFNPNMLIDHDEMRSGDKSKNGDYYNVDIIKVNRN